VKPYKEIKVPPLQRIRVFYIFFMKNLVKDFGEILAALDEAL
jgi:hypothetical protein